jgi:hypothetical protein
MELFAGMTNSAGDRHCEFPIVQNHYFVRCVLDNRLEFA